MSLQLHLSSFGAAASTTTTPNALNSPFLYTSSSSSSYYKVAHLPLSSSFHGRDLCLLCDNAKLKDKNKKKNHLCFTRKFTTRVFAMSSSSSDDHTRFKMNLNEYMVTLQKPLGIRFALSVDGKIFVHALRKGGNAEKTRIIMVGDALKKASIGPDGGFIKIKDLEDTQKLLKEDKGTFSLVLERPSSPVLPSSINQLDCVLSEEEPGEGEWAHGSFPLEEYIKALDRAKGELYYDHSLGMRYSKITEQLYVGSCIQTEADVHALAKDVGVTAVLNFQTVNECANWGIDSQSINDACRNSNILMVNYPIREVDSFDLRKKLPLSTGLLLRLLKKNLRVYVTCTTGFDRAPASIIAYLHWMQDTSLHDAFNFVTGLHPCMPNRPSIVWATWDLIAMARDNRHDRPPTHAVTFVWNGREGEDVSLVGDFTENWKEPIKLVHKGGPKYEAEVKLKQGKYYYKFIANGNWRHSTSSPTETDKHGNMNNVITVGDTASIRPSSIQQQTKDATVVKVIERSLTEYERVILARAARCVTFSICPIRLAPK